MDKRIVFGIAALLCLGGILLAFSPGDSTASVGHGSFDEPLANISTDAYSFLGDTTQSTYDEWYLEPYGSVSITTSEDRTMGMAAEVTSVSGMGSGYLTISNGNLTGTVDSYSADISVTVTVYIRGNATVLTNKIIVPDNTDYTHTVFYNANGGSYTGSEPPGGWNTTITDHNSGNTNVPLSQSPFYNAGYDFMGWDINGTVYQPGDTVAVQGFTSVTAYAQWGKYHTHTISYDPNGGSEGQTVLEDSIVYTPNSGNAYVTLAQNTYTKFHTEAGSIIVTEYFTGWSVNGTIYLPGQSVSVAEDGTVIAIAQWTSSPTTYTHTITYDANGGSGTMSNTVLSDHINENSYVTLANNGFTNSGNIFIGWSVNGTTYLEGVAIPVSSSVTAYAQWETSPGTDYNHTIVYDANGGTGVPSTSIITNNYDAPYPMSLSTTTPTMSGFTFLGWRIIGGEYVVADGSYNVYNGELIQIDTTNMSAPTILVDGDETVYAIAQWRDNSTYTHTIQYNAGSGGSGVMTDTVVTDNYIGYTYVPLAANGFTKTNYNFTGWLVNGTTYNPGDLVPVNGNTTVTATAQWTEQTRYTHTITYDANGGSGTMPNTVVEDYIQGNTPVPLSSCGFTYTGYIFTGWRVDGTDYQPGDTVLVWSGYSKTAYAQWEEVVVPTYIHSISYNANGGSGSMQNTSVTDNNSGDSMVTLDSNGFSRTGFDFIGWMVNNITHQPGDSIPVAGNDTVIAYAQWQVIQYTHTITYDSNGGSGTMPDTVVTNTISGDYNVPLATNIFSKQDYAFRGWMVSGHLYQEGDTVPVAGNSTVTATALWGNYYHRIAYNPNGGDGTMSPTETTDLNSGDTPLTVAPNGFIRSGYDFVEWNTNANGSGTSYQPNDIIQVGGDSTVNLYAQWLLITYTHTIVYDANGGIGSMQPTTETNTEPSYTGLVISPNGFTYTGYDFTGWDINGSTYQSGDTVYVLGDETVTAIAQWSLITYTHTIIYDANGGSGTMANTVYTDTNNGNSNVTLSPVDYIYTGYDFAGWKVGNAIYQAGDSVSVPANGSVTAIAQWSLITYTHTISYDPNGGSGTIPDSVTTDGNSGYTNVQLSQNTFLKSEYNFTGWLVNDVLYQAGDSVPVIGNGWVVAIAQWTHVQYTHTVYYNANGGGGTMPPTVVTNTVSGMSSVMLDNNAFTNPGYEFTGWDLNGTIYQPGQTVNVAGNSSVIVAAQWSLITYTHTVSYNANGGYGNMADSVVTDTVSGDSSVPLDSNGFSSASPNLVFGGWLINGGIHQSGESVLVGGNQTEIAYAQWVEVTYTHTIYYDANGGLGTMLPTVVTNSVAGAYNVTLDSNAYDKTGFIFTGWDVDGTVYQPGQSVAVGGDSSVTAYAQWEENAQQTYFHTITYASNGGSGTTPDTTVINTESGITMVNLAINRFTYTGYNFMGWDVNGTTYYEGDPIAVAGDTTVTATAQWMAIMYNHVIRYNANGGTGTMADSMLSDYNSGDSMVLLLPNGFERPGYNFAGWSYEGNTYQPGQSLPVAGGTIAQVYAQWSLITYTHTVRYSANGGEGSMEDSVVTNTESGLFGVILKACDYTYTGMTFKGWMVGGTLYAPGQTIMVAGNDTVTASAHWSANTLTLSANDISGYSGRTYQSQISATANNGGTVTFGTATCTGGSASVSSTGLVTYTAPSVVIRTDYGITVSVTAEYPTGYVLTRSITITATIDPFSQDVTIREGQPEIDAGEVGNGYHVNDITFNGVDCDYYIGPKYTDTYTENELDGTIVQSLIGIIPLLMIIGIVVFIARSRTMSDR